MSEFEPGKSYECVYPFVECEATIMSEDGPETIESWRPGTRFENYGYDCGYDCGYEADGLGERILTVISVHKPGKYPTRIYYTQKWRSPNGNEFGKNDLKITTVGNFKLLLKGHRHGFEIDGEIYHGSVFKYGS